MNIVSIGESAADFFPLIKQTLAGGISLNFAVQARRSGADNVALVSAVGRDKNGRLILDKLAREGIDASHVTIVDGRSACCEIVIRPGGERYFPPNSYHQNCMANFALTAEDLAFVRQHDIAVSRYDQAYAPTYFDQVMLDPVYTGRRTADFGDWFDYDGDIARIFPYFEPVDLAFISGTEQTMAALTPVAEAAQTLLVVTRGQEGSSALFRGRRYDQPAVPVKKIIDTTGAGDAFQAAFTVAYFRTGDISQALEAGARQAAKTLQHVGATPG